MKIGIVIAAYNEAKSIATVIGKLPRTIDGNEVVAIVVDDGSSDATAAKIAQTHAICLRHVMNRGQGAALHTGFDYALQTGCDIIVSFDADGQHKASEIPDMIKPIIDGKAEVALGSRFLDKEAENMSSSRGMILKMGVLFTRMLSNIDITDTHNGFRAFSREALEKMNLYQDRMEHASEILDEISRNRIRFVEVPVTIHYSDYSKKKGQKSSAAIKIAFKLLLYKLVR